MPSILDRLLGRFRRDREREVPSWEPTLFMRRPADAPASSEGESIVVEPVEPHALHGTPQTAEERENDLDYMKRCCDAELKTMAVTGLLAAPFYFERVALLSHRAGDYRCEIRYCEKYLRIVEAHFSLPQSAQEADVRLGPTYRAIVQRLPKARELLNKSKGMKQRARPPSGRGAR